MTDPSDYSIQSKLRAEVIDKTPVTYLARFPDGQTASVSKTSTDGMLVGIDDIDPFVPIHGSGLALLEDEYIDKYGATGLELSFEVDLSDESGTISVDDTNDVPITGSNLATVIRIVNEVFEAADEEDEVNQRRIDLTRDQADRLYRTYKRILESRVREEVINDFSDRFYGVTEVTDEGWVIQDTYLVTYEAENYLVDEKETFEVNNNRNGVTRTDGVPQAVKMLFDAPPMAVVENSANGSEYTLSENELEFLAMVQVLTHPGEYLGVESFEEEVYNAITRAVHDTETDQIAKIARDVSIKHYVDPETGLLHHHSLDKHVLTSSFKVRPWVIRDLEFSSFDHAGLAELAWREQELRNADRDVFYDTDNDDGERWGRIQSIEGDAPCPSHVYQTLTAKYGPQR